MSKYYYTIGEVSNLLDIKPHVIRYWETEFPQLKPRKERGRNRQFTQDHIQLLMKIKNMLYNQKLTIAGARQKLKLDKKNQEQMEIELFGQQQSIPLQTGSDQKNEIITELKHIKSKLTSIISEIQIHKKESS